MHLLAVFAQTRCRFPFTTTRSGYRRARREHAAFGTAGDDDEVLGPFGRCAVVIDGRGRIRVGQEPGPAFLEPEPVETPPHGPAYRRRERNQRLRDVDRPPEPERNDRYRLLVSDVLHPLPITINATPARLWRPRRITFSEPRVVFRQSLEPEPGRVEDGVLGLLGRRRTTRSAR